MHPLGPPLWLLVVVGCGAAVAAALWWLWATRPRVDVPGPPTLPILGNILDFRDVPLTVRKLRSFHRQYGDLTRFYFGPVLAVMVAHPDDVQQILLTSKFVERDRFSTSAVRMFVGDGLLTLPSHRWRMHRKIINTTFHAELLEAFMDTFHEGGLFLCERLARTKGAATEVHPPVVLAAVRTICKTLADAEPHQVMPDSLTQEEISFALHQFMISMTRVIVQPWMRSEFLLQLSSAGRKLFKVLHLMRDGTKKLIAMKAAATEKRTTKTRQRLTEALIKPGGQIALPLYEVESELITMLTAGTETSAVTISFVLALLSLHPEWQDAVQEELREVFGEGEDRLRGASVADLGRLRVLDSVIKETLRLYPPVPMIPRVATEDIWLSKGRVLVPKGTLLPVMPFLTHRLPEFFPDPGKFDPSRFLEDGAGRGHPCSYLPFGLGARNCVGSQYARMQLKVFLADVLRRFRILPHTRREDLEETMFSISQNTIEPIRVCFVPLHEPSTH